MRVMMVLTDSEPLERAVRRGELASGQPWRPRHLAGAEVIGAAALVFVRVSALSRPSIVAVLHGPVRERAGWRAERNTTRLRDITSEWLRLEFADSGPPATHDVKATLRQARLLSKADLKLLRVALPEDAAEEELRCSHTLAPKNVNELSDVQRKQLVAAGRGYDGRRLSAEQRLNARDPDTHLASLLIRRFEDASGKRRYDVFSYRGDSGNVFQAGTTKIAARIVQGRLQCSDQKLRRLLDVSLHARHPARRARSPRNKRLKPK